MSPFPTKGLLLFSGHKKYKKWNVAVQICCALLSHLQHNVSVKYSLSHHFEEVKMDLLTLCFSSITKYISLNKNVLLFRLSSFHQDLSVLAGDCHKTLGLRQKKEKKNCKQVLGNAPSIKCLSLSLLSSIKWIRLYLRAEGPFNKASFDSK